MPNFIQTTIYKLRKPDPVAGNKINDFAAIIDALADDTDAALGTSIFASGDLKISACAAPPTGWLACDGSAVSRTGYPSLFAAISTAYGAGDGSSTFNLPDYRGRTIVGAGAGAGLTARTLGAKAGEESHALSVGEMPAHNHGLTAATGTGISHDSAIINDNGINAGYLATTAANGGDNAHNNMQPYSVCSVFIKT